MVQTAFTKKWSKTWEDVENSRLPPDVIDEIPDAQVFGVMTCHVDDLTLYGNRGFLERLTKKPKVNLRARNRKKTNLWSVVLV